MSFDNLTMTSVTFHSGLEPPPPLAAAKFIDTHHSNNSNNIDDKAHQSTNNISSSDHHHHLQKASDMPSPRKSVEFILHPPPAKRSKLDSTWTAKQVVDGKLLVTATSGLLPLDSTEEGTKCSVSSVR